MKYSLYFLIFISLLFNACSVKKQTINLEEQPKEQVLIKNKKITKQYKGSLYSQQGGSLFADKKDLQVGDILQVNISESLKNTSKNSRDLSKNSSTSLGGAVVAPVGGIINSAGTASRIAKLNNNLSLGIKTNSSNSFKGSTSSKFDEKFSTIVSVVITRIYKNGNYFISGKKELLIDNQKQKIAISGIIRPYDISPTNTVLSSQIANLKLLYKKDGDDTDSMNKSWGTKLLEKVWPF